MHIFDFPAMSSIKCLVCGDDAVGTNYNAISCVSCRTFFIRNSTRTEKLKCIKDNQCQIDVSMRKCCSLCRWKKCISVGMKVKRPSSTSTSSTTVDVPNKDDQSNSAVEFLHLQIDRLHISTAHQDNEEGVVVQQIPLEVVSGTHNRKRTYASGLGECERQLIYELQNAMAVFVDERTLPESRETWEIVDLINWPTVYVRRIITFCKNLQSFKSLHSNDQLLILKSFYLQHLLIRAMFNYDTSREGYPVMEDEHGTRALFIKLQQSALYKCDAKIHEFTGNFASTVHSEMENDVTIKDLLIAQLLFRSTGGLTDTEFVRMQFWKYSQLLKRYLISKYKNVNNATKKYLRLVNMLKSVDIAMEKNRAAMSQLEISKFDHFLVELYGLVQK